MKNQTNNTPSDSTLAQLATARLNSAVSNIVKKGEAGQSTAEYALVLVAIAALVGVVISFMGGAGGDLMGGLFEGVMSKIGGVIGLG